ncbi:hypothetical protein D3C83_191020 [compost metagenome]
MTTSLTQVRAGIVATKRIAAPKSSGCAMRARSAGVGGTGRFSMIGVATSPGRIEVARIPFMHSSMLIDSVTATTARFVAL